MAQQAAPRGWLQVGARIDLSELRRSTAHGSPLDLFPPRAFGQRSSTSYSGNFSPLLPPPYSYQLRLVLWWRKSASPSLSSPPNPLAGLDGLDMEYTDSPPYLHEGDFDSSSNDSSSSPSDSTSSHYASPGQDTQASWAIDLGLSTLPSVHAGIVTLPQSTWAASDVTFTKPPREEEHPLNLTSDFWSTAPSTTVHSPAGATAAGYKADYFDGDDEVKMEHDDEVFSAHDESMSVDFDSMVREGAYG